MNLNISTSVYVYTSDFHLVHLCDSKDKGGCQQKCIKDGIKVVCDCNKGYELKSDNRTCVKVHPCDEENNGGCAETCVKNGTEATCSCPEDLILAEDKKSCKKGEK